MASWWKHDNSGILVLTREYSLPVSVRLVFLCSEFHEKLNLCDD